VPVSAVVHGSVLMEWLSDHIHTCGETFLPQAWSSIWQRCQWFEWQGQECSRECGKGR